MADSLKLQALLTDPTALPALYKRFGAESHAVVGLPDAAQVVAILSQPNGLETFKSLLARRSESIDRMVDDPLRYGFKPSIWNDAAALLEEKRELLIMGGNRSAKTEFAAFTSVTDLSSQPNRIWGFAHSSEDSSVRLQHPRIHKYFPPEGRSVGKAGRVVNMAYTAKNGFSGGSFIMPNQSMGFFFNYKQDVKVLEGYEFDGFWCDELVTEEFLEAVRFRLVTRKGVLITTFTPVEGYTPTVGSYLAGARVIKSRSSPLLPGRNVSDVPAGQMPYTMDCVGRKAGIIFFFTQDNPFNPYEEMCRQLSGRPNRDIKLRAYGWPEKATGNAFPRYSETVHVIKRKTADDRPEGIMVPPKPWMAMYPQLQKTGTNIVFADPGIAKNWFITWFRIGAAPEHSFIYREWPNMADFGPWALASNKPDGKPGPGQRTGYGGGILHYKRLILEAEGWVWDGDRWDGKHAEEIFERDIDPRMGGAEVPSEEEGTSIIALMEEEQKDRDGRIIGPSMIWRPAVTGRVIDGIQLINDRLEYNVEKPVDILNCPRLYVVEDCMQTRYALREYTGLDGEKGALKDVVDPPRYFVKGDWHHVAAESFEPAGGGSY